MPSKTKKLGVTVCVVCGAAKPNDSRKCCSAKCTQEARAASWRKYTTKMWVEEQQINKLIHDQWLAKKRKEEMGSLIE
jgi:predicted nucleic acid-binding Zn ribbon protein